MKKRLFVALAVLTGSVAFAQKKVKQQPPPPPVVGAVKFPPPTVKPVKGTALGVVRLSDEAKRKKWLQKVELLGKNLK